MLAGLRMIAASLLQGLLLLGFSPILKHLASQLLNLFDRHCLGLISRGTVGNRLIHLVGYFLQPPVSMRPLSKALIQSLGSRVSLSQFIAHELLYLYTFYPCTISKLRNL